MQARLSGLRRRLRLEQRVDVGHLTVKCPAKILQCPGVTWRMPKRDAASIPALHSANIRSP